MQLPEWLTAEFPEHDVEVTIRHDKVWFVVSYPNVGDITYLTIEEAYDDADLREFAPVIDESCNGHGGELHGSFWFSKIDEKRGTGRLLLSGSSTRNSVEVLEMSYKYFLELTEEYLVNPDDFVLAYRWVERHPAFWTRRDGEKTFHWETEYGLAKAWIGVGRDENGRPEVMIEHGGHVESDYVHHYHDTRLDVISETFEEAWIAFAEKVHEHFNLDGTDKEVE